ncbi:MAG: glycosyltransferase family 4 protein [Isosphaeraceae bacterium]
MPAEPSKPLTIALTCPGWPPDRVANGVASYVADVAGGLRRLGHIPVIFAQSISGVGADDCPFDLRPIAEARGMVGRLADRVAYRIGFKAQHDRSTCRGLIRGARRAIVDPGIELLEMEEAFGWPRNVAPRVGIPLVVRLHGPWFLNGPLRGVPEDEAFRLRVERERQAILAAAAISSPSRDALDRTRSYYGLPLEGAEVVENPCPAVPPERRWRLDACDRTAVVFVGRFDRHKGGDVVIDAFTRVAERRPDARLIFIGPDCGLVGDDGRHWTLPDYIQERTGGAIAGRIEWRGQQPRSEAAESRLRSMITVVASRYETFGIAVTEAMAQGCPLVATRAGAIAEIVEHGNTGLLCRPGNAEDMAAAILSLFDAPALAARLGANAAGVAERRFHPDAIARKMAEFYRRAISKEAGRGRARAEGGIGRPGHKQK